MSAEKTMEPLLVKVVGTVDESRAAQHVIGAPQTFALTAAPTQILTWSERRIRAVISIVGNGVVAFGNNGATMSNAATGSSAAGALVQGPATFELQSTNAWFAALASGANTSVSVIPEVEGTP